MGIYGNIWVIRYGVNYWLSLAFLLMITTLVIKCLWLINIINNL